MLQALLEQGVHARQSFKPLHLPTLNGKTELIRWFGGCNARLPKSRLVNVVAAVKNIAEQQNVTVYSVKTGSRPKVSI